jgi:bilirubin oxidase
MHVIAGDNGLFSRADGVQVRPYVVLAPFERVELYEDFGQRRSGREVALISREFSDNGMMGGMMDDGMTGRTTGDGRVRDGMIDRIIGGLMHGGEITEGMMDRMMGDGMMGGRRGGGMMGRGMERRMDEGMMGGGMGDMMGGMMSGGQGKELLVARFTVSGGSRTRADALRLPEAAPAARQGKHELYTRVAFRHMRGSLNGRTFNMHSVADDEHLPLNEGSVWTFSNEGGGMMSMSHPMHIHGVRFRVLERSRRDAPEDLREGLIDTGFKDTFLIFPGEQVRVLVAPTEPGLFMYHCHNLEHEDGGMMRNCQFG